MRNDINDAGEVYEEFNEIVGSEIIKSNFFSNMLKNVNWHHYRTLAFWACVFIVGGLQALKGSGIGDFTTAIAIIGFFEHSLQGNSS